MKRLQIDILVDDEDFVSLSSVLAQLKAKKKGLLPEEQMKVHDCGHHEGKACKKLEDI